MANRTLARRYATAIFNLAAQAKVVDRVGKDLHAIETALYTNAEVRRFYLSPVFERSLKMKALQAPFAASVHEIALHSLLLLIRKRRESLLPEIATAYDELALEAAGLEPLEIVSAHALAPSEVAKLVGRLEQSHRKRFSVSQRTDPSLLGGVRITMGDRRIDGTLAGRLDELARDLSTNVSTL